MTIVADGDELPVPSFRAMVTKMVADPEVSVWDVAPARTDTPATLALPIETTTTAAR